MKRFTWGFFGQITIEQKAERQLVKLKRDRYDVLVQAGLIHAAIDYYNTEIARLEHIVERADAEYKRIERDARAMETLA